MGKVKQPTKVINALKFGEFSFSSPSEISEAINNDFSNVGQWLANEIPPSNLGFSKYVACDQALCLGKKIARKGKGKRGREEGEGFRFFLSLVPRSTKGLFTG